MWHPSRGISFSPEPKRSPTTAPGSRPFGYSALAADNHKDDTLTSINKQNPEQAPIRSERKPPLEVTASYPVLPQADDALPTGNIADNVPLPVQVLEKKTTASDLLNVPYPALEYKMSEDLFRAAKKAIPGAPSSYWTYALYRGPKNDKPKIHYCRSKHTAERVCQEYFANEKLLGFDLEWAADSPKSAGPRRNVSLIQLASPSRIALFHVAAFPKGDDLVAPTFKKIMENPEVTKVGVWIKGDATRLRTHLDIDSKGLMELSHLYRLVTYSRTGEFGNINKRLIPLATQVEQYLHLPMFKGQDVRSSDWTQPLNMEQVTCKLFGLSLSSSFTHSA